MRGLSLWLFRFAGICLIALLGYFLLFGALGNYDIDWALPWKKAFRAPWPDLPFFTSWKTTTPDGRQEVIYQVPSRQLTPQEVARLRYTPSAATNVAPTSAGQ